MVRPFNSISSFFLLNFQFFSLLLYVFGFIIRPSAAVFDSFSKTSSAIRRFSHTVKHVPITWKWKQLMNEKRKFLVKFEFLPRNEAVLPSKCCWLTQNSYLYVITQLWNRWKPKCLLNPMFNRITKNNFIHIIQIMNWKTSTAAIAAAKKEKCCYQSKYA